MKRLFAILLCLSIFCSIGAVGAFAQAPADSSASASDTADTAAARSTLIYRYTLTHSISGNTIYATATLICNETNLSSSSVRVYIQEQREGETGWTNVRSNNAYGGTTASATVSYTKESGVSYRAVAYYYAYGLDGTFETDNSKYYF